MNLPVRRAASVRAAAALLAALLFGALPGAAVAHDPDPILSTSFFGQDQALLFDWRSGSEPPASLKTAVKAAAADATASRGSRAASLAFDSAGKNPIGYGAGNTCGPNGIACFTRNAPTGFTMWFREQGHVFDWGSLRWCQTYTDPPNGCFDVETIALDEFGHVEGLDHHVNEADGSDYQDAVVQTYSRAKPKAGWDMHGFGPCDVATLQLIYDMTSWSAKYSTCNELDTTLTVAAPATAAYGTAVTIVATLKVTDDDAYQRLGANPLSGRTVTLQTRAPGSSAWLAAGTMAAGNSSGTYSKTLTVTADLQVRAVFNAPADEGLAASVSGAAVVDVAACRVAPCPQSVGPVIR